MPDSMFTVGMVVVGIAALLAIFSLRTMLRTAKLMLAVVVLVVVVAAVYLKFVA